jgi:signal transduction histidine kinase
MRDGAVARPSAASVRVTWWSAASVSGTWWSAASVAIAAATVEAEVLGVATWHDPGAATSFSGTVVWAVAFPVTIVTILGIAWWNLACGDRRLARWSFACAIATTVYALASALMVWLPTHGGSGTAPLAGAVTVVAGGWTAVLALLQASVLVAGESALGRPFGRRGRVALLGAASLVMLTGVLFPPPMEIPDPADVPTLLPVGIARSAVAATVSSTVAALWMISTLVLPITLWVAATRARGTRRRLHVRLALGSLLPAMVILLCGVLGAMLSAGAVGDAEMGALAGGFALAHPATLGWLTLTVRDATAVSRPAMTTVPMMVRALLWVGYALAVFQISAPLGGLLGTHPTHGALATTLVLAVTLVPWALLVRWCVNRSDPRATFAGAVREATAQGLSSGTVAEHALREALANPEARLLLRRTPRRWTTAAGSPTEPPPAGRATIDDLAVLPIDDEAGRTIGAVLHGSRFVDTRSLARIARPLVERAILEADVREQADLALAERRRADNAAHEARRRIERDLHDGVQGRLVSLGLGLSLAREESSDPVARDLMDQTVAGIHDVVAELRELSSGAISSRLTEHGLATAVGDLVRRMPLPVDLDIPVLGVPAPIEETAYFVIAEALANTVKHGAACRVRVSVAVGSELVVRVRDDGIGGVDPRLGTGLRGLQERVHAVGGRLVVSDARPHGTLVEAVLPCGS